MNNKIKYRNYIGSEAFSETDDAMDALLQQLDEGIDDMEAGRVHSVGEAWKEIDRI